MFDDCEILSTQVQCKGLDCGVQTRREFSSDVVDVAILSTRNIAGKYNVVVELD